MRTEVKLEVKVKKTVFLYITTNGTFRVINDDQC